MLGLFFGLRLLAAYVDKYGNHSHYVYPDDLVDINADFVRLTVPKFTWACQLCKTFDKEGFIPFALIRQLEETGVAHEVDE